MLILISSAKTMAGHSKIKITGETTPRFLPEATEIALHMTQFPVEELARIFKISPKLAWENYQRYREFHSEDSPSLPAILAYTGVVFRHMGLQDFLPEDFSYAQDHLRIGSGMYGLLRPMDKIKTYRMEYDVRIPELGNLRMDAFWKDKLTDQLIDDAKKAGGTLINLAASDLLPSFHWKKVQQEVRVITPDFKMWKGDRLRSIVIYLKMARGKLTCHILKNRLNDPEVLKQFVWEGFAYNEELSKGDNWIYTQE